MSLLGELRDGAGRGGRGVCSAICEMVVVTVGEWSLEFARWRMLLGGEVTPLTGSRFLFENVGRGGVVSERTTIGENFEEMKIRKLLFSRF